MMLGTPAADLAAIVMVGVFAADLGRIPGWFGGTVANGAVGDAEPVLGAQYAANGAIGGGHMATADFSHLTSKTG